MDKLCLLRGSNLFLRQRLLLFWKSEALDHIQALRNLSDNKEFVQREGEVQFCAICISLAFKSSSLSSWIHVDVERD